MEHGTDHIFTYADFSMKIKIHLQPDHKHVELPLFSLRKVCYISNNLSQKQKKKKEDTFRRAF